MSNALKPRTAHLASATLPAAGAFTTGQTKYTLPRDAAFVTFWVTYTRGAAGGYPSLKVLLDNGTEEGAVSAIDSTVTAAQPNGSQPVYPGLLLGPQPQDGSPVSFCFTVDVRGGASKIRVLAAEAGVTGTPGTCAIALTVGS